MVVLIRFLSPLDAVPRQRACRIPTLERQKAPHERARSGSLHRSDRATISRAPHLSTTVLAPLLAIAGALSGAMSGADLNAATIRGDRAAVEKLLQAGVSADYSDTAHNGAYPLHRCAWRGFPEIAALLLQHGANADCRNTMGATPLMNTAITNQPAVTKVLLEGGADRSIKNNEGKTALDIAKGSSPAVAALLAADSKEL